MTNILLILLYQLSINTIQQEHGATMAENILFGKTNCPQCVIMKNYLDEIGLTYNYVDATLNIELLNKYAPGVRSVPQFVYQGKLIGDVRRVIQAVGNGDINV